MAGWSGAVAPPRAQGPLSSSQAGWGPSSSAQPLGGVNRDLSSFVCSLSLSLRLCLSVRFVLRSVLPAALGLRACSLAGSLRLGSALPAGCLRDHHSALLQGRLDTIDDSGAASKAPSLATLRVQTWGVRGLAAGGEGQGLSRFEGTPLSAPSPGPQLTKHPRFPPASPSASTRPGPSAVRTHPSFARRVCFEESFV